MAPDPSLPAQPLQNRVLPAALLLALLQVGTLVAVVTPASAAQPAGMQDDVQESLANDEAWDSDDWSDEASSPRISGFAELGFGLRSVSSPVRNDTWTLAEGRVRITSAWHRDAASLAVDADLLYDHVTDDASASLRTLSLAFSPSARIDVRAGRQILTWGTGDFLFLNDLFPKDWVAFFSGRDEDYLKAPSDALRISRFADLVNVDLVYTPVFEADRYLTGERFAFFSPLAGALVAPQPPLAARLPSKSLDNGELALRLYRKVGGSEMAAYAYRGYTGSPTALTQDLLPTFSRLNVFGASLRRSAAGGIANIELARHVSVDDRAGDNPLLPNSQWRWLIGYERELIRNLTWSAQFYGERILHHDRLAAASPTPEFEASRWRTLLTSRLTLRARQDRLTGSVFIFWSPTDHDWYLRPKLEYRYSDAWTLAAGINAFGGERPQTFFAQLAANDNAWLRFRFHY